MRRHALLVPSALYAIRIPVIVIHQAMISVGGIALTKYLRALMQMSIVHVMLIPIRTRALHANQGGSVPTS